MKKVYLIYAKIPKVLWENKLKFLVQNKYGYKESKGENYIGLYAWTTDDVVLEDFLLMRKEALDLYVVKKHNFDKEEFEEFRQDNIMEKLDYYQISSKATDEKLGETKTILCTKNEFQESSDYGAENLFQYFVSLIQVDYYPLKNIYREALDDLGYTVEFDIIHGQQDDEFYQERFYIAHQNQSWNMSGLGRPIKLNFYDNNFLVFSSLFFEMIMGFHENQVIRFV